MKYKLLTFNQDYADEHNVPALACMTEKEYTVWLKSPSGILNPNYEKEIQEYQQKLTEYDDFCKELQSRNLWTKRKNEFTEEELTWYKENEKPYVSEYDLPKRVTSSLNAWLGNNGDCFEELYEHLFLMEEFVQENIVKVYDVSKEFYNTFHKASLSSLSLCNVFCIKD